MNGFNFEDIKKAFDTGAIIRARTPLYNYLIEQTQWLSGKVFPRQRLWHLVHDIKEIPSCKRCDNKVKWDDAQKTANQTYRTYCSKKCQLSDPDFREQKQNTERQRYGEKRELITKKTKKTVQERYGVDYASQMQSSKDKKKQTIKEKYGVSSVIEHPEFREKREKTMFDKFGVRSYAQQHLDPHVLEKLQDKNWLENKHIVEKLSMAEIANSLGVNCEIISRHLKYHNITIIYYPNSLIETEIVTYIKELTEESIQVNNRTLISPRQLDIVLPDRNIAFEVDGIFWHSEQNGRGSRYHLSKTEECESLGINLMHIFENEWNETQNIVKSMIAYKLHHPSISQIYARKCQIVELSNKDASCFLNEHHIQGYRPCLINLGLLYEGVLVSCMSFGKSRFTKKYQYELYRFCSRQFTNVVGAASKIFKCFIIKYNPTSVISYRDKKRGSNSLYQKLGFEYSHNSAPNYWYFKRGEYKLHSRISFQKHKLKVKLETFDPNLTEWENMKANKYDRIWDCGNAVYIWERD